MKKIKYYESSYFPIEKIKEIKNDYKILVVFSTFGTREADLIYDKISLLRNELGDVVDGIYLSHRREGAGEELTEKRALEAYGETEILICNNMKIPDMSDEKGKGSDMRRALYHINSEFKDDVPPGKAVVVFLDADVVTEHFGSHFVMALAGAVIEGHDFAKASFWRAMGRVKKLVAQPLFSLLKHDSLNGLKDFSYPLSGEVAGTLSFFNSVNFWQIYGVETGILIDSCMGDYRVADVNLGLYDHEHQGELGVQKMAFGIMRTYFKKLLDYGIIELKKNAEISDIFKASFIDEDGKRQELGFDLTEKKYEPLSGLF
ncbi:hypothetical protein ACFL20_06475 [Spirochaetota bacterium]